MRLRCSGVGIDFHSGPVRVTALDEVWLDTQESEFVSIVGPSGCGKTTLLRAIAGLLPVTRGRIERIAGRGDAADRVLTVFQEDSLFPWMTVLDNAAFGLEMQGVPRPRREAAARELLARFGFAGRERAYPHQLSLGMKQRVAVIRCFLADPALMLMDEPFAALDALTRLTLQEELLGLWERDRKTVIFVTHDLDEAIRLSDRIVVMSAQPGRIVSEHLVTFPRPRHLALVTDPRFLPLKARLYSELGLRVDEPAYAR
jgi:NitT/TauT family transport system ATP-binding protein